MRDLKVEKILNDFSEAVRRIIKTNDCNEMLERITETTKLIEQEIEDSKWPKQHEEYVYPDVVFDKLHHSKWTYSNSEKKYLQAGLIARDHPELKRNLDFIRAVQIANRWLNEKQREGSKNIFQEKYHNVMDFFICKLGISSLGDIEARFNISNIELKDIIRYKPRRLLDVN
jgi:hypothetical protein